MEIKLPKTNSQFTEEDIEIIKFLREVPILNVILGDLRRDIGIPNNGISINNKAEIKKCLPSDEKSLMRVHLTTIKLLKWFGLPFRWYPTMGSILLFNCVIPPDDSMSVEIGIDDRLEKLGIGFSEVRIIIRENIKWDSLKKLLSKRKKEYDEVISKLPENPKDIKKIKTIGKIKEINKIIKNNPSISLEGIADKLNEKYEYKTADNPYHKKRIKQFIERWYKQLKKYLKQDNHKNIIYAISRKPTSFDSDY